ncbi:MAG: hypothetical protein ACK4TR_16515 [Phenylobacterium sp.]
MPRPIQSSHVLAALILMMAALFAFSPVAEAAACAPEALGPAASAETGATAHIHSTGDESGRPAAAHGCAHGHCHSPATPPQASSEQTSMARASARLSPPPAACLRSTPPESLT